MMPDCPNVQYTHNAEKSRDTTLDDEKYDVRYRDRGCPVGRNMSDRHTLCNQPEAFAAHLGDHQSRYL